MTTTPDRPLTIDEYAHLDEDDRHRWELRDGHLVPAPSPTLRHTLAVGELALRLGRQLTPDLAVLPAVEVDLELVPAGQPGSSRRPDLVVVEQAAVDRTERVGGLLRASDVLVVVEIVPSGSRRTDQVVKRGEYADAGIAHYWIVDLNPPPSVVACQLVDGLGYRDRGAFTGEFAVAEPFDIRLNLNDLR